MSIKEVEQRLTSSLGTRVRLKDKQGKGIIQISYYSNEDLDRLLELLANQQIRALRQSLRRLNRSR